MKMKNKKKGIILNPIKVNWSLSNWYLIQLSKLTRTMVDDILLHIELLYKQSEAEIELILDSKSPVYKINQKLAIIIEKWQIVFNKYSRKHTVEFVDNIDANIQKQLKTDINKVANNLVVGFSAENQKALLAKQAVIKENVGLIKSIPSELHDKIEFVLNQSISRSKSWSDIAQDIQKIGKVTKNRAKLIAKDQIFKATSVISHARQSELGIKKQVWDYTFISKEPRESHKKANGKVYNINEGCLIDNEYIYPSQKINCKCSSRPYFEIELEDED